MLDEFLAEWQLLSIFNSEPELSDDAPWLYNCLHFERTVDLITLSLTLEPAYEAATIELKHGSNRVLTLTLNRIEALFADPTFGQESLRFAFIDDANDDLILTVTPSIAVTWGLKPRW